ncbi:hypothetical protein NS14008_17465 [Nocardia seriolae]|nr:hypothetical protein NS14008_17465 [Nocardia seriolae]
MRSSLGGRHEVHTRAAPEAVWQVLAEVTRIGEWSHECLRAEWLDGATAPAVRARFRGYSRSGFMRWSRVCEFTVVDPPHELVWITHGGIYGDTTEWRFRLEPRESGTRIVQQYRVLSLPVWFDRLVHLTVPAHHDRDPALQSDLVRLADLCSEG